MQKIEFLSIQMYFYPPIQYPRVLSFFFIYFSMEIPVRPLSRLPRVIHTRVRNSQESIVSPNSSRPSGGTKASESHPRQCRSPARVATWYELERVDEHMGR